MTRDIRTGFKLGILFFILLILSAVFLCSNRTPTPVVDTWSKPFLEAGYKPANPSKPSGDPGGKTEFIEEIGATPVLYASGITQDSLVVEIVGAYAPDGSRWLQAWVEGERVELSELDWFEPASDLKRGDWSAVIESAWVKERLDIGVGVSWEPVLFMGLRAGVGLTIDINQELNTTPDWIALTGRMSLPLKGWMELDIGAGIRFESSMIDRHFSMGIGVRL